MLGANIKKARKEMGLTLGELGNLADMTASYLSQVERELAEPSISALRKIGKALNVPIYELLMEEDPQDRFLIRKHERSKTNSVQGKHDVEFISPVSTDTKKFNMVGFYVKLLPSNENSVADEAIHGAEEMIYVIKGVIEVVVEEDIYVLNSGDSLYILSNLKHTIRNVSEMEAEIISCISPAIY